jgi:hypothetical protein
MTCLIDGNLTLEAWVDVTYTTDIIDMNGCHMGHIFLSNDVTLFPLG